MSLGSTAGGLPWCGRVARAAVSAETPLRQPLPGHGSFLVIHVTIILFIISALWRFVVSSFETYTISVCLITLFFFLPKQEF